MSDASPRPAAGDQSVRCLIPERERFNGPVTRRLLGRLLAVYGGICAAGLLPLVLDSRGGGARALAPMRDRRRMAPRIRGRVARHAQGAALGRRAKSPPGP